MPDQVDVKIFKFSSDLSAALENETPQIMGFANYSWNFRLSYEYVKRIKKKHPEVVIIFGGPNYELSDKGVEDFWEAHPLIDFHVVLEGELACLNLVERLAEVDFEVDKLKACSVKALCTRANSICRSDFF